MTLISIIVIVIMIVRDSDDDLSYSTQDLCSEVQSIKSSEDEQHVAGKALIMSGIPLLEGKESCFTCFSPSI